MRLVGSSNANLYASIAAGINALSGPSHGGANEVVLIMLECVNNALEHAFPTGPGNIEIRLTEAGKVRTLQVSDNGVGVPEGALPASGSLGLTIITALASQLGGEWSLQSTTPGATARLSWPQPEHVN